MALASWANSKIVGRYGLRRVGHSASAALVVVTAIHAAIGLNSHESLTTFIIFQALTMCCFALASSNLSTLAMEHMAEIAGTASSVQGVVSTIGAAILGFFIGRAFDGTLAPYLIGVAISAAIGFLLVLLTEPKRLFAPMRVDSEQPVAAE
jgi:DHA1 family bicyclomycin/chloramphenicol resistance-like MFS transporter